MVTKAEIKAHGLPSEIPTEDVFRYFFALGSEMQRVPKNYREAIFKSLRETGASGAVPKEAIAFMGSFMAGWMDYP